MKESGTIEHSWKDRTINILGLRNQAGHYRLNWASHQNRHQNQDKPQVQAIKFQEEK
jgi:hypothetical protein